MRIQSFSYCFPSAVRPTWGIFTLQRLAALARRPNVELDVVAPVPCFPVLSRLKDRQPPKEDVLEGLRVSYPRYFYLPKILKTLDAWFYARGLLPWVARSHRRARPDLLDAHFVWPDGAGVGRLARALGLPYVITLRGALWVVFRNERIRDQCIQAMNDAAALISLSQSMVDVCCELGVSRDKFTVIHNGVDRAKFFVGDKQEARRALGLPTDGRLIACVAYYQRRKGILELVQALAKLPEDVRLVLVGSRVAAEAAYYQEVLSEIDRLDLARRVFRVGHQPHGRIGEYFRAADASALPSYWEGCPNAVVESLACGTPVAATPVGSVPEILHPGRNGIIVPMRDSRSLAQALGDMLDRTWNADELSEGVSSWTDVAAKYHQVLQAVGKR